MIIDAHELGHKEINDLLRTDQKEFTIENACGQRFIASGMSGKNITINGVPGNALGAYLNGCTLTVNSNAQDAVGDTMNDGEIIVHGSIGDAAGYAMRGGNIYIRGNAGYRAGVHMKTYKDKIPVIVIGGTAGSFLGEYQAGGIIIVLGIDRKDRKIAGNFPSTGMHGGKVFLRGNCDDILFPSQVSKNTAQKEDIKEIKPYLEKFSQYFGYDADELLNSDYTLITPDSRNPYQQMYVAN